MALKGAGLHMGVEATLELRPADPDTGVVFVRSDLVRTQGADARVAARLENLGTQARRTILRRGATEVHTTEHLLAALAGAGVHNVEVWLSAPELPGLDGSALPFYEAIRSVGTTPQGIPARELRVTDSQWRAAGGAWIAALPDDEGWRICYTLDYAALAIGVGAAATVQAMATQYLDILVTEETFARDIAPARTFVFEEEVRQLRQAGLGKGANPQNTLVIGKEGILENRLRFRDEFVRHKVLDLIGDLYLLGGAPLGRFVAARSGHALNVQIAQDLELQMGQQSAFDSGLPGRIATKTMCP